MFLEAKVQTAKVDDKFFSGLEMIVLDRGVEKRPKYTCRVVRGWPGLDELREMRKQNQPEAALQQAAAQIPLPAEDQIVHLIVVDVTGKGSFKTLICEVAAQTA